MRSSAASRSGSRARPRFSVREPSVFSPLYRCGCGGSEVTSFGRTIPPYRNSELLSEIGVDYISTKKTSLGEASSRSGPFDLIFEATGFSPLVFEAMEHLGKNGVLVLSGVTGGGREVEVPADAINLGFVLGNKVMVGTVNANRTYFEAGGLRSFPCRARISRLARKTSHPSSRGTRQLPTDGEAPDGREERDQSIRERGARLTLLF